MEDEEKEFEMEVECFNCGKINYVYPNLDPVEETYEATINSTALFEEATDHIFAELVKDGFAPNSSAIRQVIRYFSEFCEKKADEMFGGTKE
jgi:hypothetical protein